ncbi:MAG: cation:proton antiporter [Prevotellaceae bacterium]|nr:cation:proton antiporter [Prevotellaceae bacterium]
MSEIPSLVQDLAVILIVAGIVTLLFKKLKQPLVLGYIVAGFLVSPQMTLLPVVVNKENIQSWADIGVMFLLFSLGLDFSFKKIIKMGSAPVIAALTIVFSMMLMGICVGKMFGWSQTNCIFLGGMLAMSSTTIIYKAFDDLGLRQQKFAGIVMSVLILEDILAIVMMVMLSAVASGNSPDGGQMVNSILRIAFFLTVWLVVGIFAVPIFLRKMRKLMNSETLLIVSLGLCCLMAVISTQVGFSSAFGAFIMGSILAETIEADKIIKLVEPVKNLFGAVFFVSVGMLVEPQILVDYALPIIVITLAIIIGQSTLGTFGYMLSGQPLSQAIRCGFSMAQIGEFAFIIASLGLSLGVIGNFLYPVVVAVSVITTFLTPYMIRGAVPAYMFVEKKLPKVWVRRINRASIKMPSSLTTQTNWKLLLRAMGTNVAVYGMLSIAVIALMENLFLPFSKQLVPSEWTSVVCSIVTVILISPFLRAMVVKKNHSEEFKALWVESHHNRLPLISTILARIVIAMTFVFYVFKEMTTFSNALMLCVALVAIILMVMSRTLKRSSIRMERMFVQNLRSRDIAAQASGKRKPLFEGHLLDRDLHISEIEIPEDSLWAGKTLMQLRLNQRFGINVSSILRGSRRINIPSANDVIFPGDKLSVIGDDERLTILDATLQEEVYPEDYDIENREMKLERIVINSKSKFLGKTLMESGIRGTYNCMVVGLESGEESLSKVSPMYVFKRGDILWIVGEESNIAKVKEAP